MAAGQSAVPSRCAVDEVDILHQEHRAADAVMMRESPSPSIVAGAAGDDLDAEIRGMTSSLPPSLKVVPSSSSITLISGSRSRRGPLPHPPLPVAISLQMMPPLTFEM